jgi:D-glycero-D-manno-heptose 1,7-bisphosphate phosphatase
MKIYDCIFLDRDGTINSDHNGYISSLQNYNLFDFTIPALKKLSELGNKLCIITNQSGISRGLIKEENLNFIHDFIIKLFRQHEIALLKIYTCFDHPDYATNRRKPGPGMFLEAKRDYGFDLKKCLMIGDSYSDMKAGLLLNMDTMLVLTGHGQKTLGTLGKKEPPTYIAKDLYDGVEKLCH